MMTATAAIGAEWLEAAKMVVEIERARQVSKEGWSSAHDDRYVSRQLEKAADCYTFHGIDAYDPHAAGDVPHGWPWDARWWKPYDRKRDLSRAGALLSAEIDRIERIGSTSKFKLMSPTAEAKRKLAFVIRELAEVLKREDDA